MKLWKDMTPEEKGALLLAHHEGKPMQYFSGMACGWEDCDEKPAWYDGHAYRVKPEAREFWLVNLEAFTSEWAAKDAQDVRGGAIIHVVEKLE